MQHNELRALRESYNVSQRRLALYLGLSNEAVRQWELRQVVPLERLALYRQVLPLIDADRRPAA